MAVREERVVEENVFAAIRLEKNIGEVPVIFVRLGGVDRDGGGFRDEGFDELLRQRGIR